MSLWLGLVGSAALAAAPAAQGGLLKPADLPVIVEDVAACYRHMSITGPDINGLIAAGWRRYETTDLPERSFLAGIPLFSRGDGVVIAWAGAGNLHGGCTVVAIPRSSIDRATLRDGVSAALGAAPVFEGGAGVLWAPKGANDVLVLMTPNPVNAAAVNFVMRASVEEWERKLPPRTRPPEDSGTALSNDQQ